MQNLNNFHFQHPFTSSITEQKVTLIQPIQIFVPFNLGIFTFCCGLECCGEGKVQAFGAPLQEWSGEEKNINVLDRRIFINNLLCILQQNIDKIGKNMNCRLKWATWEEQVLREMGKSSQKNRWTSVADLINEKDPNLKRTAKQCREKYNNFLIFEESSYDPTWSCEEQRLLFQEYKENGARWKKISEKFPHKSQNTIKNRFYGSMRKVIRKLNKIGREQISRSFKPIRQKSIMRVIETDAQFLLAHKEVELQLATLREQLLIIIERGTKQNHETPQQCQQYVDLIKKIQKFNCVCRFMRHAKHKAKGPKNSSVVGHSEMSEMEVNGQECPRDSLTHSNSEFSHIPESQPRSEQPLNTEIQPLENQQDKMDRCPVSSPATWNSPQSPTPNAETIRAQPEKQKNPKTKKQKNSEYNFVGLLQKYVEEYCKFNEIAI